MKKTQLFKCVSEILSICIFLSGSVVLIGWIFDIPVLKSISLKFVTMKANTAICFILIGLSLWLSQAKRMDNRLCRGIASLCAFVVFLTGFLTFWEYMLGWDFGIDQLLFKEPATAILTSAPGRMAFNTSIIFIIISIVLFMTASKTVLFSYPAQLLVIPAGIIALLSFVGYLYGASPLYIGLKFSTAMAVHTCVLFIMSCIGYLFARPEQGLMKNISSDNYGGLMLRRILPVVIFVPLVLGGVKIYGERTKWFSNEFGVSLVATSNLVVISLFVYILSVYLNRLDAKRKQAETTLYKINTCLLSFGTDLNKNIQLITETVGEITGAACTLYNRRRGEMLVTEAGWKVPPDLNRSDQGEGHICFDVIKGGGDEPTIITDLQHSRYAETDPNVKKYNLHSYIGYPVKLKNEVVASLCAVFGSTIKFGDYPLHLLQILSKAASMEEERNKAQQRQTETFEQLEKTNRQLSEFAHLATHDLKTPLRGISVLAEWLAKDYHDKFDEQGQKQIGLLVKRVRRMDNLINAVLQHSTIVRNKKNEHFTDLNILFRTALAEIKPPSNIKITTNKDLPIVICEEGHIYQVFYHLLANAVRFMNKTDGRVTIDYADEDTFWRFSISDNGPGIEQQHFERIFQLFQTLDNRDETENTGVGLSLVKKIVELYGGRIWLVSQPGQGTTFNFTLPKQQASINPQISQPAAAGNQQ